MLDLLIGIFMMTGTQFTQLDNGRVAISTIDADKLKSATEFQSIIDEGMAAEDVVIINETDPSSTSINKE
jgi:hypothetical protein